MGDCAINIDYPDSVDKEGNVTLKAARSWLRLQSRPLTLLSFRHRPEGCCSVLLHQGSGKGRHGCSVPRGYRVR